MDTNKPTIVMPAIYKFDFPNSPETNSWGWHRATELMEAINNILASEGKKPSTAKEINQLYPFVNPNKPKGFLFDKRYPGYLIISKEGTPTWRSNGTADSWLESLVTDDYYLPARLGMQLINAVKNPIRSSLKKVLS
jgi:hypothetical protein